MTMFWYKLTASGKIFAFFSSRFNSFFSEPGNYRIETPGCHIIKIYHVSGKIAGEMFLPDSFDSATLYINAYITLYFCDFCSSVSSFAPTLKFHGLYKPEAEDYFRKTDTFKKMFLLIRSYTCTWISKDILPGPPSHLHNQVSFH